LDDLHPDVVDLHRDLVALNMDVLYAGDQLLSLGDLKFVLLDRDDQLSRVLMLCDHLTGDLKMGGHSMVDHYLDELKTDDRYSIHRDLMQLRLLIHHVIRQNVPMMVAKKVDLNLDGHLTDDHLTDDLMMNAPKIRRVKMKVGMNYYGHY
jgi:hypothetical protein